MKFFLCQIDDLVEHSREVVHIPNEEFTIFGVLLFLILILIVGLIYFIKKYNSSIDLVIKITGQYETLSTQLLTIMNDLKQYIMVRK